MPKFRESEAVVARCLSKKMLSKISQIAQEENPCQSLPSTKPQALRPASLLKRNCNTGAPSTPGEIRKISKNIPLYRTPPMMEASGERQNMI